MIAVAASLLLLGTWGSLKDYISNEKGIDYYDARNPHNPGVVINSLKSYPKVDKNQIYFPNQNVEFNFECIGSNADRWILHLTGTAFEENFGYMTITIDDSPGKRFRTFAFKDYRHKYVIDFNKRSKDLPKKVKVGFSFSEASSGPLFEMPLIELIAETVEGVPLPPNTLFPTSHKRFQRSGDCQVLSKKTREVP